MLYRNRSDGLTFIEFIFAVIIIALLAVILLPVLVNVYNRSLQRATMHEMHTLALTLALYQIDHGTYPPTLQALSPKYIHKVPTYDRWGNPFVYQTHAHGRAYRLISYGANGIQGPQPQVDWFHTPYAGDTIVVNGSFIQAPIGIGGGASVKSP